MKLARKVGATSEIWQIKITDSTSASNAGLIALTSGSSGLTAYYHRDTDTTATVVSLTSMTLGTFTSSGFLKIDDTNMPGAYQFCPPNAALASGAKSVMFTLKGAANMVQLDIEVDLDAQVDVTFWNGTVVATPATAGIPDVNAKNINNVATTSVTTINANQGTTQPLNFTGTAGSALVKSDMVDVAGAAVSTTTAQIGVNAVQINGQTTSAAGTVTFPGTVASATNITAGTITTVTNLTNAPTAGDLTATMKTSVATAALTTQMTESYAAAGTVPTLAQAVFEQRAILAENTVASTTVTTKKIDGSTTAHTYTINSATVPTSITTAT